MKKKCFILFICTVIIIAIISITIAIFGNSNKNNINGKAEEEIHYLDSKMIGMLNSLNNISFSNSVLLEQNTIKGKETSGND